MQVLRKLNDPLEQGLAKAVFDHVRNYLAGAFILVIGVYEFKQHASRLHEIVPTRFTGMAIICLAFILIGLNLYDGIRKISSLKYHLVISIGLVLLYVIVSFRLIVVALSFRIII